MVWRSAWRPRVPLPVAGDRCGTRRRPGPLAQVGTGRSSRRSRGVPHGLFSDLLRSSAQMALKLQFGKHYPSTWGCYDYRTTSSLGSTRNVVAGATKTTFCTCPTTEINYRDPGTTLTAPCQVHGVQCTRQRTGSSVNRPGLKMRAAAAAGLCSRPHHLCRLLLLCWPDWFPIRTTPSS